MAKNLQASNAAVNAALDAFCALLNNGYIKIYTGSQPATGDTALGAQTLLSTLRFNSAAFVASSAGVATAGAITPDTDIAATGTAAWARCLKSDGTTVICDMTVGTSGCDINLNSVALQQHAQCAISSMTLTLPKGS